MIAALIMLERRYIMDKLDMRTSNLADENFKALAKLFPNAITETIDENGEVVRAIDADILRQEISCNVVEGKDERYQFTWPDKKKSIIEANSPINLTLRPSREKSVDFDNTENIYIEGDNLYALKLLRETYLGKIKLIYIDPPYNTGNDFVYVDDFRINSEEWKEANGLVDELGNRLFKNPESNGRFHSDWCSMIRSRLVLARDLLSDDGAIFISIDDNELSTLRLICDEVFGPTNFISNIIWIKKYGIQNDAKYFSISHDYIVAIAKNKESFVLNQLPRTAQQDDRYKNPDNDPRGPWKAADFTVPHVSENRQFEIALPSGRIVTPAKGRSWGASMEDYQKMVEDNRIWFGSSGNNIPAVKKFLTEVKDGVTPTTIWSYEEVGHTDKAKKDLTALFDNTIVFDYPKSVSLIKKIIRIATNEDDIVLDFFSGSATTAQAVMELNAEIKESNRKYILVQLPELLNEKSDAYKAGYENICQIGEERIRRAAKKIEAETNSIIDYGFRTFQIDSSNMKEVYYNPSETEQTSLFGLADNIKEDRSAEDLLFQVMLDLGVMLSSKIEKYEISGKEVFNVADGFLIACFDLNVTEEVVKEIAKKKPYYVVFRDNSMASDCVATNFDQIFASISPDTVRKVL